jgi:hypothetical protein
MFLRLSALSLGLLLGAATNASAQERATVTLGPRYPEYQITVYAGGDINAAEIQDGCVGMVGETPQLALTLTMPRNVTLIVSATSPGDVALAVNTPDGQWFCNDDAKDLNPEVWVTGGASGLYNIYVGAVGAENQGRETELIVSY